ncbi:hypothetical protein FB451DRAFT_1170263 [Mycena latifolia]|nr:hypothetical protein FB451DRAFT_1170263 [Mycena latifolia]
MPPVHPAGSTRRLGRRAGEGAAAQRINRNPNLRTLGDVVAALARMPRCPLGRTLSTRRAPERVAAVIGFATKFYVFWDVNIIRPEQREALSLDLGELVVGNHGALLLEHRKTKNRDED